MDHLHLPENHLLNLLNVLAKKNDNNEIIFTSLQVLRNTYKYSLEKTNILSLNTYNIYFLWLFVINNMQNILFNYFFKWKIKLKKIRFKKMKFKKLSFLLNTFYFFSNTWFLILFSIMIFKINFIRKRKRKKIVFKKPKKKVKIKKYLVLDSY